MLQEGSRYSGPVVYSYDINTGWMAEYAPTPEGKLVPRSGGWVPQYFIKDHLGNVRAIVEPRVATAPQLVWQLQGYYPFGMALGTVYVASEQNNLMYNGKEFQLYLINNQELAWIDYGRRMYDPSLGRFMVQDRFAEKYMDLSPYQYAANNPILNIDVNGDSINVSNLIFQNGQLNAEGLHVLFNIVSDLQDITGLSISVNGNGMLAANGGNATTGSAKARNYVNGLIGSKGTISISNDNSQDTNGGGRGTVNINSNQIDDNIARSNAAGMNELTYGYGMSFLHESTHTATGTFVLNPNATTAFTDPTAAERQANPFALGTTVPIINEFRNELGLPERSHYAWIQNPTSGSTTMSWQSGGATYITNRATTMSASEKGIRRAISSFNSIVLGWQKSIVEN